MPTRSSSLWQRVASLGGLETKDYRWIGWKESKRDRATFRSLSLSFLSQRLSPSQDGITAVLGAGAILVIKCDGQDLI